MSIPTGSYRKVFYTLRPAKQVQRRMVLDTLQRLLEVGFPILDYQYTGLGSIYFVDFILFHRYLGIKRLLSAEYDLGIENRVEFNKPFGLVKLEMSPIGDVIPQLDSDLNHLLWLDYDCQLNSDIASDVVLAAYHLPTGSILLTTVDASPPANREGPKEWMEYYAAEVEDYFEAGWKHESFARSSLPSINSSILMNAIKQGIAGRPNINFIQLFKFLYADGHHPMLTLGGIIGTDVEARKVQSCDFSDADFVRLDDSLPPYVISVPRLTIKERMYLDRHMPCADGWEPDAFELSAEEVRDYRSIYRYYPLYAELLI